MRQPEEEALRKIVGDWLHKAEQDMKAAEALSKWRVPSEKTQRICRLLPKKATSSFLKLAAPNSKTQLPAC